MKKQTYIAAIACITLSTAHLNSMTAKMPAEKELTQWLRKNQFSIFVRELSLGHELASKEYSQDTLAGAISICRTETHVGKTLAQREIAQKSPSLSRKLFAAFVIKPE